MTHPDPVPEPASRAPRAAEAPEALAPRGIPPLTRAQQRLGLGLAAFATVFFASTGVPLFIAIGLAMTVGLAVSAWRRNRIAAAVFAFVTTFGPWVFAYVFGAAYAIYALWLLSGATSNAERRNDSNSARRRTRERNVGS